MSKRVFNFYAGPATLPLPALERAQAELLDFAGTGMSVLEISHRSKPYEAVHDEAQALVKELLGLGDDWQVLLLQGGASLQFAMVPMNFLAGGGSGDYVLTGDWSEKAQKEAKRFGGAPTAATTGPDYKRIPKDAELTLDPKARYVHITTNNTVHGTQWHWTPKTNGVPIVADMSSDMLWKKFDAAPYGLIYAGAQKNLGPAGLTLVLAKKDFLAQANDDLPTMLRYSTHAKNNSLYNTPPCFSIYMLRNVLSWLKDIGGLSEIERRNREKAGLLYDAIDEHPDFYRGHSEADSRSMMNVTWRLPTPELEEAFCKEATSRDLVGLKGHRSVGGCRASLYNAMPREGVEALVAFMAEFASKHAPARV